LPAVVVSGDGAAKLQQQSFEKPLPRGLDTMEPDNLVQRR
jgi:hypothetical protein